MTSPGKRASIFGSLPKPSLIEVAEEAAMLSRANIIQCLVALGYQRAIFQAPRIGTPLWYEYHAMEEALDYRMSRAEWPCLLLRRSKRIRPVWFCTVSGDWMAAAAKGRGIISLAEYTWESSRHEAARRILGIVEPDARNVSA